ncbi:MAG: helix-turn-helix transcriptional regulator [Deltaproteobacteria bacterium]
MENMIADLSKRIKQARTDREITQRELSKMSGVSYSTLTKLESGVIKNPSFEVIFRITKALDIRVDDLIEN